MSRWVKPDGAMRREELASDSSVICFETTQSSDNPTVAKFATVQKEGNREVVRQVEYYSLDVVLSVGYRVKSTQGILFRRWANTVLKEYLLRGYSVNSRLNQLEDSLHRNLLKHENRIDALEQKIDFFIQTETPPLQGVFYDGQLWDARVLNLGKKCFAFTKLDAGEIARIKKSAFGAVQS